ncbi:MAG: hypothetical protein CEE40_01920 [Chloroflexi bacterium B3_Chlor]|nr:MAG: hypothetical protein CEE40_01920 [Chloroflexi bacterium B3_Chlor]
MRVLSNWDIRVMEEERHRLAREFHDGPLQALTAMAIRIDLCKQLSAGNDFVALQNELAQLRLDFQKSIIEIRDVMAEWRLPSLEGKGLREAISDYVRQYEVHTAIEVGLDLRGVSAPQLTEAQQVAIFRILQEALRNASQHAEASEVRIEAVMESGKLQVSVQDNGKGFNLLSATANYPQQGLGLAGMQERAKALGGELQIDSQPGRGTIVRLSVPLEDSRGEFEEGSDAWLSAPAET